MSDITSFRKTHFSTNYLTVTYLDKFYIMAWERKGKSFPATQYVAQIKAC